MIIYFLKLRFIAVDININLTSHDIQKTKKVIKYVYPSVRPSVRPSVCLSVYVRLDYVCQLVPRSYQLMNSNRTEQNRTEQIRTPQ